jgi:hypothetical protein
MHNKAGDSSAQIRRVRPWHTPPPRLFFVFATMRSLVSWRNLSWLELKPLRLPSCMVDSFRCGEFQKLKFQYERSLRVWAHYMFPTRDEAREAPEQIDQLRYEAQLGRNVAALRLSDHQQTCPICIWHNHNNIAKSN